MKLTIKAIREEIKNNGGLTITNDLHKANIKYVSAIYGNELKVYKDLFFNESYDLKNLIKSYKETSNKFNCFIGFWLNPEDNFIYLDLSKNFENKDECLNFGRDNKQIAIFDALNFESIKC
jgi:hypothetical protein